MSERERETAALREQLETARRHEAGAEYNEGLVMAELAAVVRERDHLRAHVAALVKLGTDLAEWISERTGPDDPMCQRAFALLDALDAGETP